MKIAFFSDVHSNLEALLAVKESLHDKGVQKSIFLGDSVGYGANPNECVEMVRDMSDAILAGNHDWAAAAKTPTDNFNQTARQAIQWTSCNLSCENKKFLFRLPLTGEDEFLYVHGSPVKPDQWNYILNADAAGHAFSAFSGRICFVGHSHVPCIFAMDTAGRIIRSDASNEHIAEGYRYIINIGSVGQPRDGDPRASYGIYDTDHNSYTLVRASYPVDAARKKIIAAGLPPVLGHRLEAGM